jgi:hypothetical protein
VNDIRHRLTLSGIWSIPWMRDIRGFAGQILGGWSVAGVFTAQTGGAFSVFDGNTDSQCALSGTNFCYPVLTGTGPVPSMHVSDTGNPDSFVLYDLAGAPFMTQADYCASHSLQTALGPFGAGSSALSAGSDQLACTAALINLYPQLGSSRNLFRTPGIWNADATVSKIFKLPREGHQLRFEADFLNLFNHANLYADPSSNIYTGTSSRVLGVRGSSNAGFLERRNLQLSLRYSF